MDNKGLIMEVQKHIYDTKHAFYKDSVRKERTWGHHQLGIPLADDELDLSKACGEGWTPNKTSTFKVRQMGKDKRENLQEDKQGFKPGPEKSQDHAPLETK